MALTRKLKKDKTDESLVEQLIMKGGSSGAEAEYKNSVLPDEETIKNFQLRIPKSKVARMDALVKKRPGKVSRNTWIMEAIEEKLQRDEEGLVSK